MRQRFFVGHPRGFSTLFLFLSVCMLALSACVTNNPSTSQLAAKQVLTFPNVGTQDIAVMDPAQGPDSNSALALGMIYSGLVRFDQQQNVLPDQATWALSPDHKIYTFMLKPGLAFSDGTPVNAQTYVYTLTRALLPALYSPIATLFLGNIVGASEVNSGKATTLSGVQALNDTTLQITLTRPTEYFLQVLASPVAYALNQKI